MRIEVISDTHLPKPRRGLPEACRERLVVADLIVHAGDLCDLATLNLLRGLGPPLVAVHGNVDDREVRRALPATAEVALDADAGGLRLGVVHDAGAEAGRLARLRARFPEADLVIFGHSHIPLHQVAPDGFRILNPGSPTDRRRQPRHTMAEVEVDRAGAMNVSFLAVDDPPGPLPDELVRRPPG